MFLSTRVLGSLTRSRIIQHSHPLAKNPGHPLYLIAQCRLYQKPNERDRETLKFSRAAARSAHDHDCIRGLGRGLNKVTLGLRQWPSQIH